MIIWTSSSGTLSLRFSSFRRSALVSTGDVGTFPVLLAVETAAAAVAGTAGAAAAAVVVDAVTWVVDLDFMALSSSLSSPWSRRVGPSAAPQPTKNVLASRSCAEPAPDLQRTGKTHDEAGKRRCARASAA